jgi:hypothetical protein
MRRFANHSLAAATLTLALIAVALLASPGCKPRDPSTEHKSAEVLPPAEPLPTAQVQGRVEDFATVTLTPVLDTKLEGNVIWCASFQLAWNELMVRCGGPVPVTQPNDTSRALNAAGVTAKDVPAGSYLAVVAEPGEGEQLRRQVQTSFPAASTPLLDELLDSAGTRPLVYCYMQRQLPFATEFEQLGSQPFGEDGADVDWFGIDQYHPPAEEDAEEHNTDLGRQVRILHYRHHEERVVEPSHWVDLD